MVLEDIEIAAANRLKAIKEQTRQQLVLALANKKVFSMKIDIKVTSVHSNANKQAPTILIPVNCTDEHSKVLVLDLGRLSIETAPTSHNLRDIAEEDFYDEYKLNMTDITAIITSNNIKNREIQRESYLVEQFSIILNMKLRKVDSETLTNVM
jgi:hypothetical protein